MRDRLADLVSHQNCPEDIVDDMATSLDPAARGAAASSDRTSDNHLAALISDPVLWVSKDAVKSAHRRAGKRLGVSAGNPQALHALLDLDWRNTKRDDPEVQLILAMYPNP